jgi:hypothetical protein
MGKRSPAHMVTFSSYWYMRGEPQTAVSDVRDRQSVNLTDGVAVLGRTGFSPWDIYDVVGSPSPGAQLGLSAATVDCRSLAPNKASTRGITSAMRRKPRHVAL